MAAAKDKSSRDKLAIYRRKRDFTVTGEPSGVARRGKQAARKGEAGKTGQASASGGLYRGLYVVQLHYATRLHYDFRLELDGVLKSWAVTRGPSLDPADRRLAVEVEDHPLDYGSFEGIIPEGQYGGGTVIVWDRGTWQPDGDPHAGLRKGKLDFHLQGERLKGAFHLVRFAGKEARRPGAKVTRRNWLLIKGDDAYARPGDGDAAMREATSVVSGRNLEEVAGNARAVWQSGRAQPLRGKGAGKVVTKKSAAKKTAAKKTAGTKAVTKTARKAVGKTTASKKVTVKTATKTTRKTVGKAPTSKKAVAKTVRKAAGKKAARG